MAGRNRATPSWRGVAVSYPTARRPRPSTPSRRRARRTPPPGRHPLGRAQHRGGGERGELRPPHGAVVREAVLDDGEARPAGVVVQAPLHARVAPPEDDP